METTKVKSIVITAREWFDKVNGNSYFIARIAVNSETPVAVNYDLPFQYGYDNQYITEATNKLIELELLPDIEKYQNGGTESLSNYCRRKGILLVTSKSKGHKKRDLIKGW